MTGYKFRESESDIILSSKDYEGVTITVVYYVCVAIDTI